MIEILNENIAQKYKTLILEAAVEAILFHDTIVEVYEHMTTELVNVINEKIQLICTLSQFEIEYRTTEEYIYFRIEQFYFFVLVIKE